MYYRGVTARVSHVLITLALVSSNLFGMTVLDIPNAGAEDVEIYHDAGNLTFKVDNHGTLPFCIKYNNIQQSDEKGGWMDETFFFFDQSRYIHTGSGDIATGREIMPDGSPAEFTTTSEDSTLSFVEDGVVDRSHGSFTKVKDINGQANDVRISQTAWSRQDEDWGIFQWTLQNLYASDLTEVRFGLKFHACVGGDNGDDKAQWDSSENVYYIKDPTDTAYIGFASADPAVPINLYWDGPKNDLSWDIDIHNAIKSSPHISGYYDNLGSVVGWTDDETVNNGLTIQAHGSISRSMIIAGGNSYADIVSAMGRARQFLAPRTLVISEITDQGAPRVEIHATTSMPVNLANISLSVDGGQTPWRGGYWDEDPVPGNGYSVWTLSGGDSFHGTEGGALTLYNRTSREIYDQVTFGQEGTAPDPISDPTMGSISRIRSGAWVHSLHGMTFGAENTENNSLIKKPDVVLNEVMFNPAAPQYGFIELFYTGDGAVDVGNYWIITDSVLRIAGSHVLDAEDQYYLIFYNDAPWLFEGGNMSVNADNVYLYNDGGILLDMVGWSSCHQTNKTVKRDPPGNGSHGGHNDVHSIRAGWVFDSEPSIPFVHLAANDNIRYCDPGDTLWYDLTVTNKMDEGELIEMITGSPQGLTSEIFLDDRITEVTDTDGDGIPDLYVDAKLALDMSIRVTVPVEGLVGDYGVVTVTAEANTNPSIEYTIELESRFNPYLCARKSVSPTQVNIFGTGYNEEARISLNVSGRGYGIASIIPQDVVFIVDRSNSMHPDDIDLAKQAMVEYVENMSSPDTGAAEHFDTNVVLMSSLTGNYKKLKMDIDNIPGSGEFTYMGEALYEALVELVASGRTGHSHNMILLTDGGWNGEVDPIDVANCAAENHTRIFAIGLGSGAQNGVLEDIADITGGENFTADKADDLRGIYNHISTIINMVAGRDRDTTDANPMIRDVLPPWIDYVPGSFSVEPDHIHVDESGYTRLEWNLSTIMIHETWDVTFNITGTRHGFLEANNYTSSRVNYTRWDDSVVECLFPRTMIEIVTSGILPPVMSIEVVDDGGLKEGTGGNILLSLTRSSNPSTAHYLIYRSETRTGFDFTNPWKRTNVDPDGTVIPLRTTWNDTGVCRPGNPGYRQQLYYTIRAVSASGEVSHTSRMVGKWSREFSTGMSGLSLPLEPLEVHDAFWYAEDMQASTVKWMDGSHRWMWSLPTKDGGDGSKLHVGKAYEVEFTQPVHYTFTGMPGAMILYDDVAFGFDATPGTGDSISLTASVDSYGNVILDWVQPVNMGSEDRFNVWRSDSRDGFWGVPDADYVMIADLRSGINTFTDSGIALPGTEYYYMVIPVKQETGERGVSTYSCGVWTAAYSSQYDTFALPLEGAVTRTAAWFCDNINGVVGMNYFIASEQRWGWHSLRMPEGAYSRELLMGRGYQISTLRPTQYTFIGT